MLIKHLSKQLGEQVTLKGWVANKRESKGLVFIHFRDGSGYVQTVFSLDNLGENVFSTAQSLTQESSVILTGAVQADERQEGGVEIQVSDFEVVQQSKDYPITPKEHGIEFLADRRHLWLRSKRQWAIMRVRNQIIFSIHKFFQERDFVQMDAPFFTGNACEGTTTLFETDFYGQPAYLSQSGQLYGEAMAMAQGLIYTFGPTFRAEKSKTRRHLSEFWMIEPEMAFYDNEQNMQLIEDFLKYVIKDVIENCKNHLATLGRDTAVLESSIREHFPMISYDKAVAILKGEELVDGQHAIKTQENDLAQVRGDMAVAKAEIKEKETALAQPGLKKGKRNYFQTKIDQLKNQIQLLEEQERNIPNWIECAKNFKHGADFGGSDETVITRLFKTPVMVYDWPAPIKSFYMKQSKKEGYVKGVDVLAPEGYGEIVGGAERETDHDILLQKIKEHELPMEAFDWYLDLRKFGSVPHAGFGLGLERLVAWICKLPHVRETIPFPRMYGRLNP